MHAPTLSPHRRSNDLGRSRDAQVCALLEAHPATAAMLVGLGWFPSRAKALKRLRTLTRRRRIALVGSASRHAGRPEHV